MGYVKLGLGEESALVTKPRIFEFIPSSDSALVRANKREFILAPVLRTLRNTTVKTSLSESKDL